MEITKLFAILYRRKFWILQIVLVVSIVSFIYISKQPYIYSANGMLMVDTPTEMELSFKNSNYTYFNESKIPELLQTYVRLIESIDFQNRIAKEINTSNVISGLTATVISNTRVIKISFEHNDRYFVARVINTALNLFQKENLEYNRRDYKRYREFLENQLKKTAERLAHNNKKLKDFKLKNNIASIDREIEELLHYSYKLEDDLNNYYIRINELERREQEDIKKIGTDWKFIAASSILSEDSIIGELRRNLINQQQEYFQAQQSYSPGNPSLKDLEKRVEYSKNLLETEIEKILGRELIKYKNQLSFKLDPLRYNIMDDFIKTQAERISIETMGETLKNALENINTRLKKYPYYQVTLGQLELERNVSQEVYKNVLEKLEEARLQEETRGTNISIVQTAQIPKYPIRPEKFKFIISSIMAGFILGIVLAFFLETLDNTVRSVDEVNSCFSESIPLLAIIPWIKESDMNKEKDKITGKKTFINNLTTTENEIYKYNLSVIDAYRTLRTNLKFVNPDEENKVISVLSCGRNEGKSQTIAELATSFSVINRKTLILDLDLRNSSQHEIFNVPNEIGITYLLKHGGDFRPFLHKVSDNLYLIPSGSSMELSSTELLEMNLKSLIKVLRSHFDNILLDSPPLQFLIDGLIIAESSDLNIFIVRIGKSSRSEIIKCLRILENSKVNLSGYIIKESVNMFYYYKKK